MARPLKDKQRISISGSVLPEISEELDAIAIKEDRTKSQVIERLLVRGIALYRADGRLSDPDSLANGGKDSLPPTDSPYLMSDPGGANAGTKRMPAKIRKDIADAKAHIRKLKQSS